MGASSIDSVYQIKLSFFNQHEHIKNTFTFHLSLYIKKSHIGSLKLPKYFHYNMILGNIIVLCTTVLRNTLRAWSTKMVSVLTQLTVQKSPSLINILSCYFSKHRPWTSSTRSIRITLLVKIIACSSIFLCSISKLLEQNKNLHYEQNTFGGYHLHKSLRINALNNYCYEITGKKVKNSLLWKLIIMKSLT